MSCDLQNRIDRCVNDRLAAAQMFFAPFLDDRDAGRMAIAQNTGKMAFADQRIDEFLRNGGRFWREIAERKIKAVGGACVLTA
jgi:hypothetical protein